MMDPKTYLEVPTDTSFMLLATSAAASADSLSSLTSSGMVVRTLRGRKMRGRQSLMDEAGAALQFPSYFGENWDALDECISNLDWMLPVTSLVLLVQDAEQVLADENTDQLQVFVSLLRDAMWTFAEAVELGEVWDRPAVPFHVVLQADVEAAAAASRRWVAAGGSLKHLNVGDKPPGQF
ncbi:barstar family protein [Paenarthrobacter nitroguajacolicus]|uniref:barstar family protein n=1 Tax=Paenarthrobacter nitroguajacolicus TaxID=211146 RepID=UPI00285CAF3E|nr:barstar family protein [Paenarthrobacter nitroguajacolicus]MDR6636954.1 RNAse (barnase) inhibitor barstar [Paenarthrobacter nitroguajacolicus]